MAARRKAVRDCDDLSSAQNGHSLNSERGGGVARSRVPYA